MVDDLIKAGRYDEARAQILTGAAGSADALKILLEIREALRAKEYDQVRRILARDGDLVASFLEPSVVKEALECFEKEDEAPIRAFLESPHLGAEAWLALGLLQIRAGNREAAKASFEEALKLDPGHLRAKTNVGNMLLEAGQTDQAIQMYQEVLKQNPDFALAHHNLGAAYRKKGQLDKSVYHVKRGQRLQMKTSSRPVADNNSPMPRPTLGNLTGNWWVWVIVIAVMYFLLRR